MSLPTIGLGLVSWKSHETLRATLRSHQQSGLLAEVDETLIWFQDISPEDEALAAEYNIPCVGGPNVGIAEGYAQLASRLKTDLVLLVENDCPSVESREEIAMQLGRARKLFADDLCDIHRLRHRWRVGEGFAYEKYLLFHPLVNLDSRFERHHQLNDDGSWRLMLRRLLRPKRSHFIKGRSIYLEENPEKLFPEVVKKVEGEDELYLTDSRFLNWTNQSVLLRPSLFLKTLMAYVRDNPSSRTSNGFQSPERPLNSSWWRKQKFRIAVGKGLFGHERVDGSWRRKHDEKMARLASEREKREQQNDSPIREKA